MLSKKFMKLVQGSRYCVILRLVQLLLLIPNSCEQRWWKTSGEQVLHWRLPGISPVSREAPIKHQEHMWTAAIGGNHSSYEVCFQFFPQTELHMLLHFSSLWKVIHVACCLTLHKVCPYEASQVWEELCTEAGPTSARAGRTAITAHNASALLQLNPTELMHFPISSASWQTLFEVPVPSVALIVLLHAVEGRHRNSGSWLCLLGHKHPANNSLVSLSQHHAWCSHIDLFVQDLQSNTM